MAPWPPTPSPLQLPSEWQAEAATHIVVVLTRPMVWAVPTTLLLEPLTADERDRVARLRQPADAHRSAAGLWLARRLLGQWLTTAPHAVPIERSPRGKPLLAGPYAGSGPWFSIAHSGDWVAVAFSRFGRVGVDVEVPRELPDLEELAASAFLPAECDTVLDGDQAERHRRFFRLWTRKEAMVKATGVGIDGLGDIRCVTDPLVENALLELTLPNESVARWTVRSLDLPHESGPVTGPAHAALPPAAVAFEGTPSGVRVLVV